MLEIKSIWDIFRIGGFTIVVIILCSITSLAVIIERLMYFRKGAKMKRDVFMNKIKEALNSRNTGVALAVCENAQSPASRVVQAGLKLAGRSEKIVNGAMERQISIEVGQLERFTSILGSIGATVVYIGLFGTVIGIMSAFGDIAANAQSSAGMTTVITGIAEALVSTAAGIFVAVPTVISYNLIMKKIDNITSEMELCSSELLDNIKDF